MVGPLHARHARVQHFYLAKTGRVLSEQQPDAVARFAAALADPEKRIRYDEWLGLMDGDPTLPGGP